MHPSTFTKETNYLINIPRPKKLEPQIPQCARIIALKAIIKINRNETLFDSISIEREQNIRKREIEREQNIRKREIDRRKNLLRSYIQKEAERTTKDHERRSSNVSKLQLPGEEEKLLVSSNYKYKYLYTPFY